MSTTIRAKLSEKNKYWIEKHRYYELKHFCLQYPLWKRAYESLDGRTKVSIYDVSFSKNHTPGDPVTRCVAMRLLYSDKMDTIERIAKQTDTELSSYILKAVTESLSYDTLKARTNIPCCKDTYYNLYRRFFWLLSREKQ